MEEADTDLEVMLEQEVAHWVAKHALQRPKVASQLARLPMEKLWTHSCKVRHIVRMQHRSQVVNHLPADL